MQTRTGADPAAAQQPTTTAAPAPAQAPAAPSAASNGQATGSTGSGTTTKCSKCGQTQQALKAANLRLKPCPCRKAQYCNQECQKEDWKRHKTECTYSRPRAKPAAQPAGEPAPNAGATAVQQPQPQQQPQQQQPQQQQQQPPQQQQQQQPLKSPSIPPAQNPQFGWNKQAPSSTPAAPQQRPASQPQTQQLRNVGARKLGNETQSLIDKNNLTVLKQLLLGMVPDVPGAVETIENWARRQPMQQQPQQQQQQMLQHSIPMLQQGGLNQMASPMISQQMLPMQSMGIAGLQHPLMMPGFSLIPNTGLTMGAMNPGIAGLQGGGGLQGSPFQLATTGGVISPITPDALRLNHQGR